MAAETRWSHERLIPGGPAVGLPVPFLHIHSGKRADCGGHVPVSWYSAGGRKVEVAVLYGACEHRVFFSVCDGLGPRRGQRRFS